MTKKVLQYIGKNILYLFPFSLFSGLFFAAMLDYPALSFVMSRLFTGNIGEIDFLSLFRMVSMLNFSSWYYFLFSLLCVAGVGVCVAMELAFVEKHMRIGKRTLNGVLGRINDNFMSTFMQILIYLIVYELWALMASAIAFALLSIFHEIVVAQYIFFILFLLLFVYVLLYVVQLFYLWLPCAEITGFTFYESLKYSTQLVSKVRMKLILAFSIVLVVSGLIFFGTVAIDVMIVSMPAVLYAISTVLCMILFTLFTIGQEVIYFETDQLERADLRKIY